MERFAYFMIRVRRKTPSPPEAIEGLVERLDTGEKRPFSDAAQLLRFVAAATFLPKVGPDVGVHKTDDPPRRSAELRRGHVFHDTETLAEEAET